MDSEDYGFVEGRPTPSAEYRMPPDLERKEVRSELLWQVGSWVVFAFIVYNLIFNYTP